MAVRRLRQGRMRVATVWTPTGSSVTQGLKKLDCAARVLHPKRRCRFEVSSRLHTLGTVGGGGVRTMRRSGMRSGITGGHVVLLLTRPIVCRPVR